MLRHVSLLALLSVLVSLATPAVAQTCTTSWTNAAGGDWNAAANWDNGVPGAADDACVTLDGTYTVTNNAAPQVSVNSLTLGGASGTQTLDSDEGIALAAPSTIGANGRWEWRIGTLSGGTTLTNQGAILIDGFFSGVQRTITGAGTVLVNDGTIDFQDDQLHLVDGGALVNNGSLIKTVGGVANAEIESSGAPLGVFTNTGTVDVQAGRLNIDAVSLTDGASLDVAAGARLAFGGGGAITHTFAGTTSGTAAPATTDDAAGALVMSGDAQFAAAAGAVWDFGGAGLVWVEADLVGGQTLTNDGLVVIDGFFSGVQRSIVGAGTAFANAGTVDWLDDQLHLIDGATLVNSGAIVKTTGGVSSAEIEPFGATPGTFVNTGSIDVSAGRFNIDVTSLTDGATLSAALGANLAFGGGDAATHTFAGTTSGVSEGTLRMEGDAQFAAAAGGTWDFGGTGIRWNEADLIGGETLTNSGLIVIDGFFSFNQRSISGLGTVLANTGTIDWRDDQLFLVDDGALANSGLLTKTAGGVSTAELAVDGADTGSRRFLNTGTIDVQAGRMDIAADSRTDGATLTTAPGVQLNFGGGDAVTHTFAGTTSGTQAGTLRMTSDAQFAAEPGAAWDFDGEGLVWVEADLIGGETLTNAGLVVIDGFFSGIQRSISGLGTVLANTGTIDWRDDQVHLVDDGAWTNAGLLLGNNVGVSQTNLTSNGTDTGSRRFVNTGTVEVRAGTLNIDVPFDHQPGARVTGFARFDISGSTFTHLGDTSAGSPDSTGVLLWRGQPWAPDPGATLLARIGGTDAGDDYDQVQVDNALALAGTLALSIADGAAPTVGDTYTVLIGTSLSGTFGSVQAPPGYAVTVDYTLTSVDVTIDAVGVETTLTGAEGWRMLAPSVTGQTLDGVVGTLWTQGYPGADVDVGGSNVFFYDESTPGSLELGYGAPASQSDAFALGTGAFVYVYADDDQDGPEPSGFPKTILQSGTDVTGDQSIPVSYTDTGAPADDGWTLAGNPFAATLDWTDPAWTRTDVSNAVYVWDPTLADYRTHNTVMGSLTDGLVAPGQGMWVQAMAASPVLTAPGSARTVGGDFAGRATTEHVELRLEDSARPVSASAFVGFDARAADGLDALDAYELTPAAGDAVALWTGRATDGEPLDLQMMAPADGARLGLGVAAWVGGDAAAADLVLRWPALPEGWAAELHDTETGETIDMTQATEYAFRASAGSARVASGAELTRQSPTAERFELRLGSAVVVAGEAAEATFETRLLAPRPNPTRAAARVPFTLAAAGAARLSVIDLLGREVAILADGERAAGEHSATLDTARLAAGVYVVRLQTGDAVTTQRLTVVR